jgi:ribosomal protein S18 acetylase RimI-like enzyme
VITVRPATAQDYEVLCEILDEVDALHRQKLPHFFRRPEGPVRERAYILEQLADEDVAIFIAEVEGQPAGLVHVVVQDTPPIPILVPRRWAMVDSIVVKERFRRRGIGRALMDEGQRWALSKGAAEIELSVFEFNKPARAFYESLGYETTRRRMGRRLP